MKTSFNRFVPLWAGVAVLLVTGAVLTEAAGLRRFHPPPGGGVPLPVTTNCTVALGFSSDTTTVVVTNLVGVTTNILDNLRDGNSNPVTVAGIQGGELTLTNAIFGGWPAFTATLIWVDPAGTPTVGDQYGELHTFAGSDNQTISLGEPMVNVDWWDEWRVYYASVVTNWSFATNVFTNVYWNIGYAGSNASVVLSTNWLWDTGWLTNSATMQISNSVFTVTQP